MNHRVTSGTSSDLNVSTLTNRQLKEAVLRNMTLEEIEALKEEARGKMGTARSMQEEMDSRASAKAS